MTRDRKEAFESCVYSRHRTSTYDAMIYPRLLSLFLCTALLVGCDPEAPDVNQTGVDFNCGKPEVQFAIDRDDETITNIIVNWGRNHVAANPPNLYNSTPLGPEFGGPDAWIIRNANGDAVTLPSSDDLQVFLRFNISDAFPFAVNEKLVLNLQVQYDRGDGVQSTFSERVTIEYETPAPECTQTGGGNTPPGPGVPPGGGGTIDTNPPTCLNDAAPDGGLALPVIDPGFADGPVDGETCAGNLIGNTVVVPFGWRPVEGEAIGNKAYQVEVRREGQASCLGDWDSASSSHFSGDRETCIILDVNTNATALSLLPNTRYEWRVRASCVRENDSLANGDFTTFMAFETRGPPEKLELRVPANGATIETPFDNTSALSVTFEWLPADCGLATYHLRIVESFEAPEDDDDLFDYPNATTVDGLGQIVTVNGEQRIRIESPVLEAGKSYVWWVFATTSSGALTPVLTTDDMRTFSIAD